MSNFPERLRFVYEKARHHRSFRADGAWATTTPKGEIQMAFFNDIRPLPTEAVHAVSPEGQLGEQISQDFSIEKILREANVTVIMDRDGAKSLIALLARIVGVLEQEDKERETGKEQPATTS